MTIVTNEEELDEINKSIIQKKYNNVEVDGEVSGDEKDLVTQSIKSKAEEKGFFDNYLIDPIASFFTGNDREEFKEMGEINGANLNSIVNCKYEYKSIIRYINKYSNKKRFKCSYFFGLGKSNLKVMKILQSNKIWKIVNQKQFKDIIFN